MSAAVETAGLTKFYGAQRGLEDLTLTIEPGEVFGYLGPNGAGKTTTIRLLLDFIRPSSGTVRVLGTDPRDGTGVAARRRIGYLPGELAFDGRDKARDLLRFLGDARGGVARQRIDELADRFELDLSRTVTDLSKGNKQKVGPGGVMRSFDEARNALHLAARLGFTTPVLHAADLLVFPVLLRDRAAIIDLVASVLGPLRDARGGPQPFLDTLTAFFEHHGNITAAARALHLSSRAVTYRLDRITALTGYAPTEPTQRFTLEAAVLGARLLDWPTTTGTNHD